MQRSLTTTSLRTHTAVASGYLHKLTHNGTPFARWHQRYYVLYSDGLLRSYRSSRARNSHRVIHVGRKCLRVRFGEETRSDECSRWPRNCPRSLRFSVINSDREYHFYCETEREMTVWRDNFRYILNKLGSAHSSYVERRGSKMAAGASGAERDNNASEDESSSGAPTPAGSLRRLKPRGIQRAIAEKREREREKERAEAEKKTKEKYTGLVEGYDDIGSAVPYTNLDDDDESDEEPKEPPSASEDLLRHREQANTELGKKHTLDHSETNILEKVSSCENLRWSVPNYTDRNRHRSKESENNKVKEEACYNMNGVEAAFLEVQAILDETFNDIC